MKIRRSRLTGDFVQIPNATVRDDRLSHMARGILVELLSRPDGWEATADDMWRASVAKHSKNSPGRRAFRAAFAELKEHGYLTAGRDVLPGGRHATVLILADVPHAGTSVRPGQTQEAAGGADVPDGGTSAPPAETRESADETDVPHAGTSGGATDVPTGGTSARAGKTTEPAGHSDVPTGGTSVPPGQTAISAGRSDVPHAGTSKEENGRTNTGKKKTLSSVSGAPRVDHHLAAFGAFWVNYPKKRDREEAKKAWIAAIERGVAPQHMVDRAQSYARERAGQDPQFTKFPATWLNKGCYDDEPDPQPGPRPVPGGWTGSNRPHPMTGAGAPVPTAEDYKNARPF